MSINTRHALHPLALAVTLAPFAIAAGLKISVGE